MFDMFEIAFVPSTGSDFDLEGGRPPVSCFFCCPVAYERRRSSLPLKLSVVFVLVRKVADDRLLDDLRFMGLLPDERLSLLGDLPERPRLNFPFEPAELSL